MGDDKKENGRKEQKVSAVAVEELDGPKCALWRLESVLCLVTSAIDLNWREQSKQTKVVVSANSKSSEAGEVAGAVGTAEGWKEDIGREKNTSGRARDGRNLI